MRRAYLTSMPHQQKDRMAAGGKEAEDRHRARCAKSKVTCRSNISVLRAAIVFWLPSFSLVSPYNGLGIRSTHCLTKNSRLSSQHTDWTPSITRDASSLRPLTASRSLGAVARPGRRSRAPIAASFHVSNMFTALVWPSIQCLRRAEPR